MSSPGSAELEDFRDAVRGVLERAWPTPRAAAAAGAPLTAAWEAAVAQEWVALGVERALAPLLAALAELGRVACPLPLADAYVATRLLGAAPDVVDAVAAGALRPLVCLGASDRRRFEFVEAAAWATHVLVLPVETGRPATLHASVGVEPMPGLAVPAWSEVEVGPALEAVPCPAGELEDALRIMRLGLAARAVGAAGRAAELALEHAGQRHAFGKPIGAFQAVSHRCADSAIDATVFARLVDEAVRLHDLGDPAWPLACDLAVTHGRGAASRIQFRSHHTLGAVGFFEEHEAPWLFRRAQADVIRIALFPSTAGIPGDLLLEGVGGLPRLDLGEAAETFRARVRAFLAEQPRRPADWSLDRDPELTAGLADRGWVAMGWPPEHGGRDATAEELMALHEEIGYTGADGISIVTALLIGGAVLRHGTDEQRQRFLPLIADGMLPFYLGYSEPEVGSDLANLQTTAVRDGDEWIVNGRKMWGTGAHCADYVWLAARTDPDASPPHAGITVFLAEVPCPGWEAQQHTGLSGEVSCSTFFDDVRIPDTARVGEVNGGWKVIIDALASERTVMGGISAGLHRLFDDLVAELRRRPEIAGPRGSAVRQRITELATRVQASRVLVNASVRATSAGKGAELEAPMAKIIAAELYQDLCEAAIEILGPRAVLAAGADVPAAGGFGYGLRMSIMYVVGGGTNDIGRNLIARGLGLPR